MNKSIDNIVLASDLGVYSSQLLRYCINLAHVEKALITVVHAVEPLGVLADVMLETYVPKDFMQQVRKDGMPNIIEAIKNQVLTSIAEECEFEQISPLLVNDVIVAVGQPQDVVLDVVDSIGADMIVCGSGSNATPLGRTASKILQLSPVPVIMVPATQQAATSRNYHTGNNPQSM